nr:ATP-binding domain-containing protein [Corynebacterium lactis]
MNNEVLASEQEYLDLAFSFLDATRVRDQESLRRVMLLDDPDPQARVEREVEYHRLQANLDRYRTAEIGLVFGRIDIEDDNPDNPVAEAGPGAGVDKRYIGRMGLSDAEDNYRTVIMDWRADGARPFYLATTAQPEGVSLRRHLRTRGRTVRAVDDEWLDTSLRSDVGDAPSTPAARGTDDISTGVGGESVLREVLGSARTGHMRGIVETIQREQDLIIRDATRGTLVVQGGPGTGKTAVALHRVAWLLYTYRDQLAKTGVLIIGPNTTFLDYISRVLPSLGETGVVLTTIGDLYPGVRASERIEPLVTQEVKGSAEMVGILKEAVRAYQLVPDEDIEVRVDNISLQVRARDVKASRTKARRTRKPHNAGRAIFREHMLDLLSAQLAHRIGADPLGGENLLSTTDIADLREELADDPTVAGVFDRLWPVLEPEAVLEDFLRDADAIAVAASDYDDLTRSALLRGQDWPLGEFSEADAPLLDELAELLGPAHAADVDSEEWEARVAEAQDALDTLSSSASQDLDDGFEAEILSAYDVIDAEALAERHRERDLRSTADRAAEDRTWAYGHVIVDEAQELSAMAWRMIRRRSPNGWMTLVGDVAQTGSPAGAEAWGDVLEPIVGKRWRLHELSVNYRTPQEIMDVAATLLPHIAPDLQPPRSIRSVGRGPVVVGSLREAKALVEGASEAGRLWAIIAPTAQLDEVRGEAGRLWGAADTASAPLATPRVYDISQAKGLEFDEVIVVNPDEIAGSSPQGLQDLYVALTRATQGLTIVQREPLYWLEVERPE